MTSNRKSSKVKFYIGSQTLSKKLMRQRLKEISADIFLISKRNRIGSAHLKFEIEYTIKGF